MNYSETMAENGRKGGFAKAEKYKPLIRKVARLFVIRPRMTQQEIAKRVGVSQAFVSDHTKSPYLKMERYERLIKDIVGDPVVFLRSPIALGMMCSLERFFPSELRHTKHIFDYDFSTFIHNRLFIRCVKKLENAPK